MFLLLSPKSKMFKEFMFIVIEVKKIVKNIFFLTDYKY